MCVQQPAPRNFPECCCRTGARPHSTPAWSCGEIKRRHRRRPGAIRTATRAAALLFALVLLLPRPASATDAGCGRTPPADGLYTLVHNGVERAYALHLPTTYDAARPQRMVLAFHGWGGDEAEFLGDRDVIDESEQRGYILVAPRGLGSGGPDRRKNSWTFRGSATGVIGLGATASPVCDTAHTPNYTYPSCQSGRAANTCSWTQCQDDDVAFVVALIDSLRGQLCIDTDHVFAAGGSNGGMFVWELGQNPASAARIRAIAPIIGLPHRADLRPPAKTGLLPVILITGRADRTVPPGRWDDPSPTTTGDDDRYFYTGATAIIRRWSRAAGCPVDGPETTFDTGQHIADCRRYCARSATGWPAVLDCRAPMGHDYGLAWSWKLVLDFFDRW